jgi:hypothetical protein
MHLSPGRLKDLVQTNLGDDAALICHNTLASEQALCRGFVDRYGDRVMAIRLARALHMIAEDPPRKEI